MVQFSFKISLVFSNILSVLKQSDPAMKKIPFNFRLIPNSLILPPENGFILIY